MASENTTTGFSSHYEGFGRKPGFFLMDDENCVRQSFNFMRDTLTIPSRVSMNDGGLFFTAGSIVTGPGKDEITGIVYEDVFIPSGAYAAAGSIVTSGVIDSSSMSTANALADDTRFKIMDSGDVTRPY